MVSASVKSVTGLVAKVGSLGTGPSLLPVMAGSLPPDCQHHPQTRFEGVSKLRNMSLPFCSVLSLGCPQCQFIPSFPALYLLS